MRSNLQTQSSTGPGRVLRERIPPYTFQHSTGIQEALQAQARVDGSTLFPTLLMLLLGSLVEAQDELAFEMCHPHTDRKEPGINNSTGLKTLDFF